MEDKILSNLNLKRNEMEWKKEEEEKKKKKKKKKKKT